ncbi:MAG: putative MATE family efflux protein [Halobacteriales archaeon]|jgi:putative MATE family efflux protein
MAGPDESRVDMTEGSIGPKLVTLAWPLVAGNLLQTVYNLADMFWVGRVDANAVAAVSLMFPTAWLFISTAMGITAAAVAVVSQHIGAGNERAAEKAVGQTVILAVGVALALAAVGFAVRHPLVSLIGAEGAVYRDAIDYIEVMFLSIPFTFLFFAFRAVLRAAGDTKTAMWLVVISAGLNVVIDPFFILGWAGFPALGTRGAAVATLISRILAALVGLGILLHGGWGIRLRIRDLAPEPAILRKIVGIGYPATLDGLTRSFAAVAFAGLVARFGPVPTAAYGIGMRLMSVSWTVSGAVGQAAATGVGQNLGARTPDRASEVAWKATAGAMGILLAAGGLTFAFPDVAMRVFIDDVAVIDEGVTLLRIVAPFWPLLGGLMVLQGAFRGAGETKVAFVLSVLSRWVFRIPLAWLLAYYLPFAALGLWWSLSISGVAAFVVGVLWFYRGGWEEGVVEEEGGEGAASVGTAGVATDDGESDTPTD